MKQLRLVLGLDQKADPPISFNPEVLARLVDRMAEAIVQVHKTEGGRSDDQRSNSS